MRIRRPQRLLLRRRSLLRRSKYKLFQTETKEKRGKKRKNKKKHFFSTMTQDLPICRFCLESRNTAKNPLIDPCECRGSLQFVHSRCLLRWRQINPRRNAEMCFLCFTSYRLENTLEMIPDASTFYNFILRFPPFLCIVMNYMAGFHYAVTPYGSRDFTLFEHYQYFFQLLYFFLFAQAWKVKNRELYWSLFQQKYFLFFLFSHFLSNLYIHNHQFVAVIPLNISLGYYWYHHNEVLLAINAMDL